MGSHDPNQQQSAFVVFNGLVCLPLKQKGVGSIPTERTKSGSVVQTGKNDSASPFPPSYAEDGVKVPLAHRKTQEVQYCKSFKDSNYKGLHPLLRRLGRGLDPGCKDTSGFCFHSSIGRATHF